MKNNNFLKIQIVALSLFLSSFSFSLDNGVFTYSVAQGSSCIESGLPRDNFLYAEAGLGAVITGCMGDCPGDLVIPTKIAGLDIIEIGQDAFSGAGLFNVEIPNGIKVICNGAFNDNSISNLSLPESILSIGVSAFFHNNLSFVDMPSHLIGQATSAFAGIVDTSDGFENDHWHYINTSKGVYLLGCKDSCAKNLLIPDEINEQKVIGITYRAFYDEGLTSVNFPESIIGIGGSAFKDNEINSLSLPSDLSFIGSDAFKDNKLTYLDIPDNLSRINQGAFAYNLIQEIKSPEHIIMDISLSVIGNSALVDDGWRYIPISNKAVIMGCDGSCPKILNIPYSINGYQVSGISLYAFSNQQLQSVIIPGNIKTIGLGAFYGTGLSSLIIGEGVSYIGEAAFKDNNINQIILPDSVTYVGRQAFSENAIVDLTISKNLKTLSYGTFSNNQLTNLVIPENVTSLGVAVFQDNPIKSLDISDKLTHIGDYAFHRNQLVSIVIPEGIKTIGDYAFNENSIEHVTLPSSISNISGQAFLNNPLQNVHYNANPVDWGVFFTNPLPSFSFCAPPKSNEPQYSHTAIFNYAENCPWSMPWGLDKTWDFDENGSVDALTDGLIFMRYHFGLRGDALTLGAVSPESPHSEQKIENENLPWSWRMGDIDANGSVDALTDGLMVLRYLFGLRGQALINDVIAPGGIRNSSHEIESYILSHMPDF